jgi:hypothetical protein
MTVSAYRSEVFVYVGSGDGTFLPAVSHPLGLNAGRVITAADVNHDGRVDLVVSDTRILATLLNRQNQGFYAPVVNAQFQFGIGGSATLFVTDFDGDGTQDVALALDTTTRLFHGFGDGAFGSPMQPTIPAAVSFAADLNEDGVADVEGWNGGVAIYLGAHNTCVSTPTTFSMGINYQAPPVAGDFNADSHIDVLMGAARGLSGRDRGQDDGNHDQPHSSSGD